MERAWEEIQPKNYFTVGRRRPMNDQEEQVLLFLYQPLIGGTALSLYLTLIGEAADGVSEPLMHAELLTCMNIGIPALYEARVKLEGIGLLETYQKDDSLLGKSFFYEIYPPVSAIRFFQDEVLTLTLREKISERKFDQLKKRFEPQNLPLEGFKKVTKKFTEVYSFSPERLMAEDALLSEIKESFTLPEATNPTVDSDNFDWAFFSELLRKEKITISKDPEFEKTIQTFHHLYGIDELEMLRIMQMSVDYLTNQVDEKRFKQSVYQKYHQNRKQVEVKESEQQAAFTSSEDKQSYRKNTLKLEGYSEREVAVILMSEELAPMTFLTSIKEQKGGYIANDERWALEEVKRKSGLPDAVLNILIHYSLVIQNNASLNSRYLNTIANDWAQKKLFTPEKAMTEVKELTKKKEKPAKTNTRYSRAGNSKRTESLPDWVDKPVKETVMSDEERKKMEERIRHLTEKEGE